MTRLWSIVYDERRYTSEVFRDPDDRRDFQPLFHIWSENDLAQYVDTLRGRKYVKYKGPSRWYWSGNDFYRVK